MSDEIEEELYYLAGHELKKEFVDRLEMDITTRTDIDYHRAGILLDKYYSQEKKIEELRTSVTGYRRGISRLVKIIDGMRKNDLSTEKQPSAAFLVLIDSIERDIHCGKSKLELSYVQVIEILNFLKKNLK